MYGPEKFRELLDCLVADSAIKRACRAVCISTGNFWSWLGRSAARNDDRFKFEWAGGTRWFDEHYAVARKRNVVNLEAHARSIAVHGQSREIIFDGCVVYARDPKLMADALDPDIWKMLHGDRPITDTFLRDECGALVRETITEPVPATTLNKVLASMMPATYGDHIDVTHSGGLGVTVIAAPKLTTISAPLDDPRRDTPMLAELRAKLAAITKNGPVHPFPLDANGNRTLPHIAGHVPDDDVPDDRPTPKPRMTEPPDALRHDLATAAGVRVA